ncbi:MULTISPECIES: MetQ/NlpA family ABC transporter substrate-binding protein [Streptomyces]|uniref:Lipoprotein n=2 Tax=Streptomyces avermitilis TaxID=33903 RepID=Q827X7_STRAW|nr:MULTISPECIES: MetQ/NlpA family ABC transporter substrate-binding protein [Streptomyces]KUN53666.1 metal ABC transporter substrate-binding protein [Streptomyces avermitilis]MYT02332.1 metal ABC transporter substrate-binding protein [Streptomyces sp. SID5469]OOV27336.1 metal ABC transporter substrate-binding protein [Streptomyces avermitilis]BAC74503.1 putative ABC transporter substrate-binding protein (D-methionine transport system substrate-binding protein) [Streptomyces avermitilis MA-4680 
MRKPVISAAAAALALGLGLTACGSGSDSDSAKSGGDGDALVVGATAVPAGEVLAYIKKDLAEKAGLDLEIKEFTDYVLPNTALQEGELDANLYQNQPYLDDFNKAKGTDLVPVVKAYLPPMGVYSKKVTDVTKLADGATVAVPNDTTNEGRALKLLASKGVIALKAGAGTDASPADITSNPKHLTFKELEPAQLPRSLDDLAAAVINNNYAQDAGLSPTKDAILLESAENNPYANLLAVKKGNEDDPRVEKLAKLLTSPEVKKFIEDKYRGSVLPVVSG